MNAPGGFLEPATAGVVRPRPTLTLPARGPFEFPAPYHTVGVRLTNAHDSGGVDNLRGNGYAYWRAIGPVVDGQMGVLVSFNRDRGGIGPAIVPVTLPAHRVDPPIPMFDPTHALSWATGEGWYWSASAPIVYVNDRYRLLRYDARTRQIVATVFDIADAGQPPGSYLWQLHSSQDDRVHSATVRTPTGQPTGTLVYDEPTRRFAFYPARGVYDEAQIDKSGRYLVVKDNVDAAAGEDNRLIDVTTGAEQLLLDQQGAGGHSDLGHGVLVAQDNWHQDPGVVRLWDLARPLADPGQGRVVYRTTDWNVDVGHVGFGNARPGSVAGQFAVGSTASRHALPRANELFAYPLDGRLEVLVIAPVLTLLDAPGGGEDYLKAPKASIDATGTYMFWTSNAGSNRLDAFLVAVPPLLAQTPPPEPEPEPPSDVWTETIRLAGVPPLTITVQRKA